MFKYVLLAISCLFFFLPTASADPPIKVVNGRVKEVWPEKGSLVLSFQHPVTGELEEIVLRVDKGTGFSEGTNLASLQESDPLSVDYEEDEEGNIRALWVKRVPLRGVPIEKNPFS